MPYELQPYNPGDKREIFELLRYLLSPDPEFNRQYFTWKYESNPFISPPLVMVVRYGGRIVAMRGLFGTLWNQKSLGRHIVLPHADDLVVHPDHRGRGLFLPLMEELLSLANVRGYDHVISLSGGETTQALSLATGWSEVGEINRHVRTSAMGDRRRRYASIISSARRRVGPWMPKQVRTFYAKASRLPFRRRTPDEREIDNLVGRITRADNISVEHVDFLDSVAELTSNWPSVGSPQVVADRSATNLQWRLGNPDRRYRILSCSKSGIRGFIILSWSSSDSRSVKIAEIQSEDDLVFAHMIRAICSAGSLELETLTPQTTSGRRFLEEVGFVSLAASTLASVRRKFLIKQLTDADEQSSSRRMFETDLGYWRFNLLETMQA